MYQLRIDICDAKPPIWRRVLVPENFNLHQLHYIIQIVMAWTNTHLHKFEVDYGTMFKYVSYGDNQSPFADDCCPMLEERDIKLKDLNLNLKGKSVFHYIYDFGDWWDHKIKIEKILKKSECKYKVPTCIKLVGQAPVEDCGGIWGYYEIKDILYDKNHPDHEEFAEMYQVNDDCCSAEEAMQDINELLSEPHRYKELDM